MCQLRLSSNTRIFDSQILNAPKAGFRRFISDFKCSYSELHNMNCVICINVSTLAEKKQDKSLKSADLNKKVTERKFFLIHALDTLLNCDTSSEMMDMSHQRSQL